MKQIAIRNRIWNQLPKKHSAAWVLGLSIATFTFFLGSYVVRAQNDLGSGPPMGAARLSSVEGQVRLTLDGQVIAESAPANAPLFAGTLIETGEDGKAEIQFDDGSVARISPNSSLVLESLGGNTAPSTDLVLKNGLAYFELEGNIQDAQTRVLFGDSIITASGFSVLRVRMDTPPGDLAVLTGNAHLERHNGMSVDIRGGESLTLDAADANHYTLAETIEPDSWDTWNSDRDQALTAEASDQTGVAGNFVNGDTPTPAWNDLDANGNWYDVPGQGYVWSPFVAASVSWDPYSCGHWMWTPRFGYVWVSCENWGYLPYSCGSWSFYGGFGWGWSMGTGGCTPWWRRGTYAGWNVGNGPSWYHPIPRPILRNPRGKNPIPVINVHRNPEGGPNELPQRGRNSPVTIAGREVEPMRRLPVHESYVRSASGFVYHPGNGTQNRRDGGQVDNERGGNDHPIVINRPVYERNQIGEGYTRHANPEPGRSSVPPSQGNGADRNNNSPGPVFTQPGRVIVPPTQNRPEPGRTYTPPQQPRTEPPQQRQYTPPPQQQQPRPEPSRPYTPPPSQHNPGGGNPGGGSFARPSGGPSGAGGGGYHPAPPPPPPSGGGGSPHGGSGGGGPVHH